MSNIKVSIIVPVFNVEKYLQNCLNSLINQTLKDIEIICINDGSTDNSFNILKEYKEIDNRIKIVSFDDNHGQGFCRNKGIELASGEYITFVDSDDWVELDFLEKTYNNAINNDSDIVLCDAIEEYGNYQKKRVYFPNNEIKSENFIFNYKTYKNRLLNYYLTIWAKLHKTKFIKENNIKFPCVIFEDCAFHVESFLKAKKITYCNSIFYHYRRNNLSSTMSVNKKNNFKVFEITDIIKQILVENDSFDEFKVEFLRYELTQFKEKFISLNEFLKEKFFIDLKEYFLNDLIEPSSLNKIPHYLSQFYFDIDNYDSYFDFSNSLCEKKDVIISQSDFTLNDNFFIKNTNDKYILKNIEIDLKNGNLINLKSYEQILNENLFDSDYYITKNNYDLNNDALLNYIYLGFKKDENPTSFFDGSYYSKLYSIDDEINPFIYYITYGRFEGKNKLNHNTNFNSINNRKLNRKIKYFKGSVDTNSNRNLIVSLTSFPERMNDLKYTLLSLFNQTLKPNKIILNLAYDEFPNCEDDIPNDIMKFTELGLKINWCNNIFSYKKLIPVLEDYPKDIIVTADDDLFYQENWLEILWNEHETSPLDIIAHRPRLINFNRDGELNEYNTWEVYYGAELDSSYLNFPTAGAGALYPPNSLHEDIFNQEKFLKICPTGDDIWFWGMAVKNKTKIKVPNKHKSYLIYTNVARELNLNNQKTLWELNMSGGNDIQIKSLLNEYPEIIKIIRDDLNV